MARVRGMLAVRGSDTVKVTHIKGHATEQMVQDGSVRDNDRLGNITVDVTANFGRLRQRVHVIDARRQLGIARDDWYPRMLLLHRSWLLFFALRLTVMIVEALVLARWCCTKGDCSGLPFACIPRWVSVFHLNRCTTLHWRFLEQGRMFVPPRCPVPNFFFGPSLVLTSPGLEDPAALSQVAVANQTCAG